MSSAQRTKFPDWLTERYYCMVQPHIQYTPSGEYLDHYQTIENRLKKREKGHYLITLIAQSFDQILAITSDYRSVEFVKVYSYNEVMVAADVVYTLSKKQEQSCVGPDVAKKFKDETWDDIKNRYRSFEEKDWDTLKKVKANGFVYAQTYTDADDLAASIQAGAAQPLSTSQVQWERNRVSEEDTGMYNANPAYRVQVWRAIFAQTKVASNSSGLGKARFLMDIIPQAMTQERMTERLHAARMHPDFEYKSTTTIDAETPYAPEGYFWRENITATEEQSFLALDKEGYTGPVVTHHLWRRLKNRPVQDVSGAWLEAGVNYKFLNKKQFGQMFGPFLPKTLAGMTFKSGFLKSIDWWGTVKVSLRPRDPSTGVMRDETQETEWGDDVALPFRVDEIWRCIRDWEHRLVDTPPENAKTE